jgi:hypothetical protein
VYWALSRQVSGQYNAFQSFWDGLPTAPELSLRHLLHSFAHEGDNVMESRKRPLLGIVLISGFYCLGVVILIVAMFFNREEVGVQIANVHGVPALAGFPILILTCIVGALVAIGLYNMTSWGYWLTLIYACYLLIVPPILVGKDVSLFGNIIWPLVVAVYLVLRRKQYFSTHQSV